IPSRFRSLMRRLFYFVLRVVGHGCRSSESRSARLPLSTPIWCPETRCSRHSDGLTFFHSAATCLHVPTRLTRKSTKHEARKRRVSERHVVGCCEVLAGRSFFIWFFANLSLA